MDKEEKIAQEENNELIKLNDKIKELEISLQNNQDEFKDYKLRTQADLQNYKRRREEELAIMFKYINIDIIGDLLPVIDNFERALSISVDDTASKLQEGIRIIYNSFLEILKKYEVKEIEALDREFDPNIHQAISTDSIEDKEDGIVLEVLQKGYMLKDKVIRPAMVKVNKKEREDNNNE